MTYRAGDVVLALSPAEVADLARHEAAIETGLAAFCAAGLALRDIKLRQLYRCTHDTFASYCKDRWGFTDRRAQQLMGAAEVVEDLQGAPSEPAVREAHPDAPALPHSERQARPLVPLPAEERREVWAEACAQSKGDGRLQPTAAEVGRLAAEALEGLAPARRAEVLRAETEALERRGRERAAGSPKDARRKHLDRIGHHARQAIRHAKALGGDDGQSLIDLGERLLAEAAALGE